MSASRAEPQAPQGIGLLMAAQWQGSLLWWSFDPKGRVEQYVEDNLAKFVSAIVGAGNRFGRPRRKADGHDARLAIRARFDENPRLID